MQKMLCFVLCRVIRHISSIGFKSGEFVRSLNEYNEILRTSNNTCLKDMLLIKNILIHTLLS